MDTDDKDVKGDISAAATATVSVTAADKQEFDVKIMDDGVGDNAIHSLKDAVEILSVEVVQSPLDVQQNKDQIAVNDEANTESEQPLQRSGGSCNEDESDKSSVDCMNNMVNQEEVCLNTAEEEYTISSDSVDAVKDSLAIEGENISSVVSEGEAENQVDKDCENNNSLPGRALNEDTPDSAVMQENITISHIQQYPEEVCQSVEDPNSTVSPAINEMEVADLSGEVLTAGDIFAFKDIHNQTVDTTLTQDENVEPNTTINSITGLSLLAQYGSDNEASASDNESVIEVSTTNHDYRNRIVEIDSDSDSSSSSSDLEYLNKIRKTIEKRMEVDDDDDEDEDDGNAKTGIRKKPKPKVKAKGELNLDDLPPIQDLQITVAEDECIVLGKIHSIVDQLVLVSALPNSMLVDLETVFFLDKGQRVLGEVFDVLGQVADPLYCVRFNSNQQINERNIQINDVVYMAPKTQYTQYIILSSIMKQKGSDASWENDWEPPPRFLDYSDDEEQQLARRQLRNKDRPVEQNDPQKRARMDAEEPQVSSYSRPYTSQPRQRYPYPTRGSGPPNRGSYGRPHQQYNPQHRNPQIPPTHNPSSWHSNYYPQPYNTAAMPSPNVPYAGGYPRMPQQTYPQVPVYPMAMPYPPPPPQQHARPPNNHPAEHHRYMPNAFNMRLPTIPGHFDPSTPPPGSQ